MGLDTYLQRRISCYDKDVKISVKRPGITIKQKKLKEAVEELAYWRKNYSIDSLLKAHMYSMDKEDALGWFDAPSVNHLLEVAKAFLDGEHSELRNEYGDDESWFRDDVKQLYKALLKFKTDGVGQLEYYGSW